MAGDAVLDDGKVLYNYLKKDELPNKNWFSQGRYLLSLKARKTFYYNKEFDTEAIDVIGKLIYDCM